MPFSPEQFLNVFEAYNRFAFPAQAILFLAGCLAVFAVVAKVGNLLRLVPLMLSMLWTWAGLVYLLIFIAPLSNAGKFFARAFLLEALFFLYVFAGGKRFDFRITRNIYGVTGSVLIAYSLIGYPVASFAMGHSYPRMPTFGVPCPVTIFTFGVLLLDIRKVPWIILVIPALWSLVGFSAVFLLGMWEDVGLLAAGVAGTYLIVTRNLGSPPGS